jgi:hypothetical protein
MSMIQWGGAMVRTLGVGVWIRLDGVVSMVRRCRRGTGGR